MRIVADERRREIAPIEQRDGDPLRLVHDVAVREDESVGREDEAAPVAAAPAVSHVDADDRRADPFCRGRDRA